MIVSDYDELDDYLADEEGAERGGTFTSALPPVWEEWLASRPVLAEMVEGLDDPLTFVVLEFLSEIFADIGVAPVGDTSVCGIAERNGWLYVHSTKHELIAVHSARPALILDGLSEPRPLRDADARELIEHVPTTWQRPVTQWTLPGAGDGIRDTAKELLAEWAEDEPRSEIEIRRFVADPSTLDALLEHWMRTDSFIHTASSDLLWEAAERELRADPESAALIDHFTVDGEVMRPLVAAMFSDNPYIARWLELDR